MNGRAETAFPPSFRRFRLSSLKDMTVRTLSRPEIKYALPDAGRELVLVQGDWDQAYQLACREEGVQYLSTPERPQSPAPKPRRKRTPRSAG
jgi:hypothetical protein